MNEAKSMAKDEPSSTSPLEESDLIPRVKVTETAELTGVKTLNSDSFRMLAKSSAEEEQTKRHRQSSLREPIDDDVSYSNLNCQDSKPRLKSFIAHPSPGQHDLDEVERQAVLDGQRNDVKVLDRNKRMFGLIVGTLKKFKTEEVTRVKSSLKRAKVESRLDTCDLGQSLLDAKLQLTVPGNEIRLNSLCEEEFLTNYRCDLQQRHKNWELSYKNLGRFIQTETKPKLFWIPKEHNDETQRRLKLTRDYFSLCVAEKTAKFKKAMNELGDNLSSPPQNIQPDILTKSTSASV